jgi:hypothetical protein
MYGLEKKKKPMFEFDLELEVKKDSKKANEYLKKADDRMREIKDLLRQGSKTADFDNLGVLLHAYTALQKILKKATVKK